MTKAPRDYRIPQQHGKLRHGNLLQLMASHMSLSDSTVNNDIDDSCTEEEDQETHNDSATSSSTMSILERLKSPTPSDLARKRKAGS